MAKKPRKKFDTGEGNLDMIKNSVTAIKHHADELTSELKKNPEIEAWVLAKVDRAAQNLSDVTHYLDGEMNKFAKGGKTPIVRTQFEEEEFEYAKGGQIAYDLVPMIPYGVKGMITPDYKKTWFLMGTEDEAFAKAKEMANSNPNFVRVEIKRKLKTKTNTVGIVDGQNKQYAKGGLLTDYSKISSVQVEDIDMNDAPDFVDAYISYAEYDGEPMTDEQLEELNQDGDFVYSAVERHLYKKGGKVSKVSKSSVMSELEKLGFGKDKAKNLLEKHIDIYEINEDDEDAKTIAMQIEEAYNQEYAKGGKVNKRWIQDALSGDKGALRKTAKRKGLIKGDEKLSKSDLRKLEKMGGKTAKRARLAETLIDFKK